MIDLSAVPGPFAPRSSAITVGTFDGVHRGHQEVLHELARVAADRQERSIVVTFDPHPLKIVRPESAPRLLTTRAEKEAIIAGCGIDVIAFLPFTYELSQYDPARFVREILIGRFGLAHLIIGYDHGFGRGRSGDVETLTRIGAETGYGVDVVAPFQADGENISSSRIRGLLQQGDVLRAAAQIGRPFALEGEVVRGDGRGRALGMPTANLAVSDPDKLVPAAGVYAVETTGAVCGCGVMHIGPRPTFDDERPTLEVSLFDFEGDLYGQRLAVHFIDRIRGIERFDSPARLAAAMQSDAVAARRLLARYAVGAARAPR